VIRELCKQIWLRCEAHFVDCRTRSDHLTLVCQSVYMSIGERSICRSFKISSTFAEPDPRSNGQRASVSDRRGYFTTSSQLLGGY
jgi:hypothetical protein